MNTESLADWLPYSILWDSSPARVRWRHLGRERLVDPFFDQTIERRRHDPNHREQDRVTSIEALDGLPVVRPPAGFIFHTSRCGSTLVAQVLASVPHHTVISEATILSSIIQRPAHALTMSLAQRAQLLRSVVNALAQPRTEQEGLCFIKFGAGSVRYLDLIRRAFPDVPAIFLYRDPLEVMSALLRVRSDAVPPGLTELGLIDDAIETVRAMGPAEFWARVLGSRMEAALRAYDAGWMRLVNYSQLPDAIWSSLADFFGATCTSAEIETMKASSRFNAKDPSSVFADDAEQKRKTATDEMRGYVDRLLMPLYERLEAIRLEQP
jgi:hypothetical protein